MHRREGKLIVAATDLVGFLECGHLTNLDRAVADNLLPKPDVGDDPAVELLRWRGEEHEKRYIEMLRAEFPHITDLSRGKEERGSYAELAALTEEAMRRGDDVIYQGFLFDGTWLGYPDFLIKVPGESALGDWHYEVADTKLARTAKAAALIQIGTYIELLDGIQKRIPEKLRVVTGGKQPDVREFRTAEMIFYYRSAKARFEAELANELDLAKTYPDPVSHCDVCKWFYVQCRQAWRDDDALPQVAGISHKQRQTLKANSVTTMRALSELAQPISFPGLKRSQSDSLWRMREQARLQVTTGTNPVPAFELLQAERDADGELVPDRGLSALPQPSEHDLFFDIEGDPFFDWEGIEYLFGVWDGEKYDDLWAFDREEEKRQFEALIDRFHAHWSQHRDMHIYHYGAYEPSRLKHLAGQHATRQEELDDLLRGRVFVDLLRVVKQGLLVGSERYSIKNLEPIYGFARTVNLRDAGSSIVEFEKLLAMGGDKAQLTSDIREYNKDDTVSTQRLRDWLEEQRRHVKLRLGEELPRPPAGDVKPPTEELTERIRQVLEMTARLTVGIPEDPHQQSENDKATWLVAHLLDWHRREDKSTYWRFFDLMSKSDDELIEEGEPIGGLKFESSWPLPKPARSDIYRYKFPPQDFKIGVGDSLNDPQLYAAGQKSTGTGTVHAIDEDGLTIDIKRGRDWAGPHPTSVVALDVIDAKAQRLALMRFAEWVATNGIDADSTQWRAARDLLLRLPPRVVGGMGGKLVPEGKSGSEVAIDLALRLDGTTLAIQGPPGSGKTYTGAEMICELTRAGDRVVGVTSNSHKVIGNAIRAVIEAVKRDGRTIRIVQKAKPHEAVDHPWVRRVDENEDVDDAIAQAGVDLVAGTPWLWAREPMHGQIDTLFVDEAGQVSLANVVSISGASRNIVLLGDPQQLDQPTQGVHPDGTGESALGHFLNGAKVVPGEKGVFLEKTWRMHPQITAYTSQLFYEGELTSRDGLEAHAIEGSDELAGSGLRWVSVEHEGNTNESAEEARKVVQLVQSLLGRMWTEWTTDGDRRRPMVADDIRVLTPYNAHRLLIDEELAAAGVERVQVGTVDKFQGQQAAVAIYSMATSRPEDAPRGMDFLYSLNRLNVATSRAKALAIVVASPLLLRAVPRTPEQLRMANGLAAFVEHAMAFGQPTQAESIQLEFSLG